MPSSAPPPVTAGDLRTLPELRHLRCTSGLRGAGLVLHAWATVVGAMILYAIWPSAVTLVAAIAVIGTRQFGLVVIMHAYHLEHHVFVFAPCWKLRQTRTLLLDKGYGPRMKMASSYVDVLRRATSRR